MPVRTLFVAAAFLRALFVPLFFPLIDRLGDFATFGFAAVRPAFFLLGRTVRAADFFLVIEAMPPEPPLRVVT